MKRTTRLIRLMLSVIHLNCPKAMKKRVSHTLLEKDAHHQAIRRCQAKDYPLTTPNPWMSDMTKAQQILTQINAVGAKVIVLADGKLRLKPASRIPPNLLAEVRRFKPALIVELERKRRHSLGCCLHCGPTNYRDVPLAHPPHNGQSTRRDCSRCGRFIDFVRWYGTEPSRN